MDVSLEEGVATWKPTGMDFTYGHMLMMVEDYSKVAKRYYAPGDGIFSGGMLFSALLYSVLSWKEKFRQHKKQFNEFLEENLWTAKEVLENPETVEKILKKYGFNKKKIKIVKSAAEAWNKLNLQERIRGDERVTLGFQLREEITESMHGVGYKFASLFLRMCGYEDLVPVDSTALEYAESRGFKFRHKDSGLKPGQYLQYEKFIATEARKFGVTPAHFQATIYAKWSTWKKDSGILF
jgi:thermostable 8-oxoguanine DNA glycosylase